MNHNLEFENEDPSPDEVEDNHPRTNYGAGFGEKMYSKSEIKQLLEEPLEEQLVNDIVTIEPILDNLDDFLNKVQSIEIIDFMYFENDLFQDEKVKSIIDRMKDENGYDSSSQFSFNYTLKVAGEGNMTVDRFKEFIFNNKIH